MFKSNFVMDIVSKIRWGCIVKNKIIKLYCLKVINGCELNVF